LPACGEIDKLSTTVGNEIEYAISSLNRISSSANLGLADLGKEIRTAKEDLIKAGTQYIRQDLEHFANDAIANVASSTHALVTEVSGSIKDHLAAYLQLLQEQKEKLKSAKTKDDINAIRKALQNLKVIRPPIVTNLNPPVITVNWTGDAVYTVNPDIISIHGYNFPLHPNNKIPLSLQSAESAARPINPTGLFNDTYKATIDTSGLPIQTSDKQLVIHFADNRSVAISVIHKHEQPKPVDIVFDMPGGQIQCIPELKSGDREFAGHGPQIEAWLGWERHEVGIILNLSVRATETEESNPDKKTVLDSANKVVMTIPSEILRDYEVISIDGKDGPAIPSVRDIWTGSYVCTYDSNWIGMTNHTEDINKMAIGGPVTRVVSVGDTKGDDVGKTMVTVDYTTLRVRLRRKK